MVPRRTYRRNLRPTVPAEEYDGPAYIAVTSGSEPLSHREG
ncbi:hypothetical protein ABZ934_11385 [Streptomyces sp. NPDC046557]